MKIIDGVMKRSAGREGDFIGGGVDVYVVAGIFYDYAGDAGVGDEKIGPIADDEGERSFGLI